MTITIGNYPFDGPFATPDSLRAQSGVYVILGRNAEHEGWTVLDIGESGDLSTRVSNHDRSDQWGRLGYRMHAVAAYYCDAVTRMRIEAELRRQFNPPCGVR